MAWKEKYKYEKNLQQLITIQFTAFVFTAGKLYLKTFSADIKIKITNFEINKNIGWDKNKSLA